MTLPDLKAPFPSQDVLDKYQAFMQSLANLRISYTNAAGTPGQNALGFDGPQAMLYLQGGKTVTIQYKTASGGTGTMTFVNGVLTQNT